MSVRYRVDFEDYDGLVIESFQNFLGLNFNIFASGLGSYTLNLSGFDNRVSLIPDDAIVRIWMTDPAFGIEWTNIFNGIHKTFVDTVAENGRLTWQSYGPSCEELLAKELVAYPSGSSQANKSGVASTVMNAYVRENIGDLATIANGRDYAGVNPITIASGPAVGPTWTGSRARKRLLFVLETIYHDSIESGDPIDFRVNYLGGYQFEFEAGKLGSDRTVTGLNNGHDRASAPVILSPRYGNTRSLTRSRSRYNEANLVIALGQGEGVNRAFETIANAESIALSPIAQRVATVNGTNETTAAGLQAAAKAMLDAKLAKDKYTVVPFKGTAKALVSLFPNLDERNFTAEVLWRDYFPFDFVTVEDYRTGERQNVQIQEVSGRIRPSDTRVENLDIKVRVVTAQEGL